MKNERNLYFGHKQRNKKLLIDSDITLTELARKISNVKNKHYTVQNLSQKLKNGTVNAKEIAIILDRVFSIFRSEKIIIY